MKIGRVFGVLVWFGVLGVCFGESAGRPTVKELLDRYAATQEKLRCFSLKRKDTTRSSNTFPNWKGDRVGYSEVELDSDGTRFNMREYIWGDRGEGHQSRENADYRRFIYDGDIFLTYSVSSRENMGEVKTFKKVKIYPERERAASMAKETFSMASDGNSLMGYVFGDLDRVDDVIRRAKSSLVRDKAERIRGAECYVVEADTVRGEYKLWIDTEHGHNIAKAEVRRSGKRGDLFFEHGPMTEHDNLIIIMENVRFDEIEGIWVPMEADIFSNRFEDKNGWFAKNQIHRKRTEVRLNPNHDAAKAFAPADIADGAWVYISGSYDVRYTWRDGKVVDGEGKEVDIKAKVEREK